VIRWSATGSRTALVDIIAVLALLGDPGEVFTTKTPGA
jgi:hypothetical protein